MEVGFFDAGDRAWGVSVSGSYAYMADGADGLRIIDVSNPASPVEVGFFDTGAYALGVGVSGSYAYVADGEDGLYIIRNDLITGINDSKETLPQTFRLEQNYPNPFNPFTTIEFSIPYRSYVTLEVYNSLGEKITTLVAQELNAGRHKINWDAKEYESGIYFYRLKSNGFTKTKKLILLK